MRFAFIVYDGMTLLDFAGMYDPVTRLKTMGFVADLQYDVCALGETVRSFEGLEVKPDRTGGSLDGYDYVFIPGGNGVSRLIKDPVFLAWMRSVSKTAVLTAVCGGALALGAAGFLKGKKATTHPGLMQYLGAYGGTVTGDRIVEDGNCVTARGVTSAIDLGLYMCQKIAGTEAREKIQEQMDYTAYPV